MSTKKCPSCLESNTRILWDILRWCEDCHCVSLVRDDRYVLSCPKDGTVLLPRVNYKNPTLFCPKCKQEFEPPGVCEGQLVEEEL